MPARRFLFCRDQTSDLKTGLQALRTIVSISASGETRSSKTALIWPEKQFMVKFRHKARENGTLVPAHFQNRTR
jgi:hypothetical protein